MTNWTVDRPQQITIEEPVARLDVRLVTGRLNVVGTDGPARVDVTRVSSRPVIVEHRDGVLRVGHERHPRWPGFLWWLGQLGRRFRAEVSIAVPADILVNLNLVDGALVASGLVNDTNVNVTSGQITLMGLAGRTNARIVSGPVEALGVTGDLTLDTVSGEVTLAESSAGRVHANTISGAITCDLDNPRRSEIRLSTISGPITVRVREDSDLAVHLHTASGRITSGFPQISGGIGAGPVKDSHGVLGAGAGKLWASATSGSIALLARPVDDDLEELP
ncbi:DUF4097 family beta strand repeat-containing protein [Micromonospora rifamycinica]|uniref:DUF4097 and DUF4098 domain-containing protein YvlB n=1 Tax=Micromonospora rifamycinica TaxID=291594 RepID=A0A109IHK0_9ACTN|nr:DUF4097 family beta strand repeat-containing protein [Micromonospora rifamycinica]KWV30689.1 hypothetical protein AWV63_21650 [Micromonospora rifamycinica]SCG79829.1 DUF4097 and DUF4098 domain-containing protein YvlB [Micromonospora rifamycinica]